MLAVIHHINSPKLKPYPNGAIRMVKNKIKQKEASLLRLTKGELEQDQRLKLVSALYSIYGNKTFLNAYSKALCEILNDAFDASFKNIDDATASMFGKDNQQYALTSAFSDLDDKRDYATVLKQYDDLIARLRKGFSYLFPDEGLSSSQGEDFLNKLVKIFQDTDKKNSKYPNFSLSEEVGHLTVLAKQYSKLVDDKGNPKRGEIPTGWLSRTTTSLNKVVGTGLWEIITMLAQEKAFKEMDVLKEVKRIMESTFGPVTTLEIVNAKQTGDVKINNKSILTDSMVEIKIVTKNDSVNVVVGVGDSTKISQSVAVRGLKSESAGMKITTMKDTDQLLGEVLGEISRSLKNYWERRMGVFLTERNTKLNSTVEHWNDTLQAIKIMTAFDTIGVRVGGGTQTLSFNNKLMRIRAIANLAVEDNPRGANYVTLTGLASIVNAPTAGRYASYINKQYKNRPRKNKPDNPERHQATYEEYIKELMNTKFTTAVNVLAASRTL